MVVIVLMALLLAAAVPFFGWAQNVAGTNNAINRAIILNSAKSQYLLEYGYVAHASFNGKTNAARYGVLNQYLGYVATTLSSYIPTGYTYSLRYLNQKTAVTSTGGGPSLSY